MLHYDGKKKDDIKEILPNNNEQAFAAITNHGNLSGEFYIISFIAIIPCLIGILVFTRDYKEYNIYVMIMLFSVIMLFLSYAIVNSRSSRIIGILSSEEASKRTEELKYMKESKDRLNELDKNNEIPKKTLNLVVSRYALFIKETNSIYSKYFDLRKIIANGDKVVNDRLKRYQHEIYVSLIKCRNDMDDLIGHELVERLFGTDEEVQALYSQ